MVEVEEGVGVVTINLTRSGNLEQEVGVVCSTEDGSARGGVDYVPRLQSDVGSEVIFGAGESESACLVAIEDDVRHEPLREIFYLHLGPSTSYDHVSIAPGLSTICIYISADIRDSE